ncbi:DUF2510 domain-containing protein [Blastococcus sp. SYSU DS0539]
MSRPAPPSGWYPDPGGGPGTRWWDGQGWTEHVQQAAPPPPPAPTATGPSLYDQPVLLVNQKTKLVELTNEYAVLDGNGRQIGAVVQVGQSSLRRRCGWSRTSTSSSPTGWRWGTPAARCSCSPGRRSS